MAKKLDMLSKSLQENLDLTAYSQVGHTHNYAASSTAGGAATSATKLATARSINGTSFNGTADITTANWGTARTITIGNSGKSVNGSGNVSWTLTEIGAAAASHNHNTFTALSGSSWTSATRNIQDDCKFEFASHINKSATGMYAVSDNSNAIITLNRHSGHYDSQLGFSSNGKIYYRYTSGNAMTDSTAWQQIYTTTNKPTPADIGAAASSHGTHVTWATNAPKENGTAAIGSVARVAREDHVHPLQTTVSGNAGSADKLSTGRTITIGNKANTFDGTANITYTLSDIGAAPTSHTHNYAGSSSAGGAANSVKTNLTIKLNGGGTEGTNLFTFNGSTAKTINITPSSIGAAASSHGTHVNYSTAAPLVAGTATAGSASNVSRGDHVHPAQTSVTGNAGTATKLATARNIQIGNQTNSFDGSGNITYTLSGIGAADATQMGVNKILFERFEKGTITGNDAATEETLIGKALIDATFVDNFGSYNVGDNYLGRLTTNLYFSEATEFTATANSDDGSTIYLNSTPIATLASCQNTTVTFNFVKGWNTVVWIFNENAGNDTTTLNPSIKTASNLVYMNAFPVSASMNVKVAEALHSKTSDNAATADKLTTPRTLTIGNTGKTFDGSANVSWSLAEIGASASGHTHTSINYTDSRSANTTPKDTPNGLSVHLKSSGVDGINDAGYHPVLMMKPWNDKSGWPVGQLTVTQNNSLYFRVSSSSSETSWNDWVKVYTPNNKPTPADIGAAAETHGTHVTWATTAPKANGTAAVGSVARVAREDHVHPLQTSVSGNAGTATKLATAREIKIGNTGKNFDGTANVSWTLSEIGAAASSHNHTSLTGVTSIDFASEGSDSSSISTTIDGSITYFDFNLADDASQNDMWRWRFTPSGGTVFNAMTLDATSLTAAKLTVTGDIAATSFTENGTALSSKYAAKAHGTHVGDAYATVAPKANGTAAIGTSARIAREDHVHPLQESVAKLTNARTIALGTGVTGTATSFDGSGNITIPVTSISEAYLSWGGRNHSTDFGPIDAALAPELGANRFAFMPAAAISIEYSRDGGSTWSAYSTSDANKISLFNGNGASHTIGANTSTGVDKAKYMLRVTISASAAKLYTNLNKFIIYCSTAGSSGSYCSVDARTAANVDAGVDTWTNFTNKASIGGWSGYNVINTSGILFGTNAGQYGQLRFTFGVTSHASSVTHMGLSIIKIMGFGGVGWTTPSTMATNGRMYTYDSSQNVTFPAALTSKLFIEDGTALSNKYALVSHGEHVSLATATPKVASGSGAVGTSSKQAREDHVHPPQTSVSGNAGTATTLQTARNIKVGNKTNSFNGSGNIEFTLSDIGALPTAGGTVTGKLILEEGLRIHACDGTHGTTGYVKMAQIKITNNYQNQAISFVLTQRSRNITELQVRFTSENTTDPTLSSFAKIGNVNAYIHKSATSTWDIYVQKTEGYDRIDVLDFKKGSYMSGTTVTWTNVLVDAVPSGSTEATVFTETVNITGNAGAATKLSTARNITVGNKTNSFDGTANISFTLSDIGAATASHTHNLLSSVDTRSVNSTPAEYNMFGIKPEFKYANTVGISNSGGTYVGMITYQQWADVTNWSGGKATQIAFGDGGNMYMRKGNNSGWTSWKTMLDSTNYSQFIDSNLTAVNSNLGSVTISNYDALMNSINTNLNNLN